MEILCEMTIGEIITVIILFGTAVIVLFYTRAMQKSNEIQERPVLNLYLRESRTGPNIERVLRLRNVGNGPAYNISFFGIVAGDYTYYPYFNEPNPILEKDGDEKTVDLWVETPHGGVEVFDRITGFQFFLSRLFPRTANKEEQERLKRTAAIFLITYEGINGKKYYSIFRLYSKIWPLLSVYDLVVEFISSGEGEYDMLKARTLCNEQESMKRFEQ